MHLAVTADERYWRPDCRQLFLGEWCLKRSRQACWREMDYDVVPYNWPDASVMYAAYRQLNELYEKVLADLTAVLNEIHNVRYTLRYWRISIGPWLTFSLHALYDRYTSIMQAANTGQVESTYVSDDDYAAWVPTGFAQFLDWIKDDPYNQYLCNAIIRATGALPYEVRELKLRPEKNQAVATRGAGIKGAVKRVLAGKNRVHIISPYLGTDGLTQLYRSLGQMPILPSLAEPVLATDVDFETRDTIGKQLEKTAHNDESGFELLLQQLLPQLLPTAVVENYDRLRAYADDKLPAADVIVVDTELYSNETVKIWTAAQVDHGAKLMIHQHGGNYGIDLFNAREDHERQAADRLLTWGWRDDETTRPLPTGKLASSTMPSDGDANGHILMVNETYPRYFYLMYSVAQGTALASYIADQQTFAELLTEQCRENLLVRLFPVDYEWSEPERWKDRLPDVAVYRGGTPLAKQLRESRLCIITYNGTALLEVLAANFPTVVFWDPQLWAVRDSAQPCLQHLADVGIFHESAASAATFVNRIWEDPRSWWMSDDTQKARAIFCNRYARASSDWVDRWCDELTGVLSG